MIDRNSWDGRPVIFVEFTIRESRDVTEAFRRDGEEGSFMLLVRSLRYADSKEPVFATVDEVLDQPFRLRERLGYLAARAAVVNGLREEEPTAELVDRIARGELDGNAEQPGPPH